LQNVDNAVVDQLQTAVLTIVAVTTRSQGLVVLVRQPGRVPLRLLLDGPAIEVGRDCPGLVLTDPKISRRHLSLQAAGGAVRVTDLQSRNGTFVGGRRIRRTHVMATGERGQLGSCTISLADAPLSLPRALADGPAATSMELVAASAVADPPDLAAMPSGARTLTLVFSDLEHAAGNAGRLGADRWRAVLEMHSAIVRRQADRRGGLELRSHEDGFLHGFPSAHEALSFAVDLHRALHVLARSRPADTVRARTGAHTGELLVGADGELVERHLAVGSRVAGAARGGELLVTGIVRELVEPTGDIEFGSPRLITLEGFRLEHLVHPVRWAPAPSLSPTARHIPQRRDAS
jgi:class 3 adenylate cyclase